MTLIDDYLEKQLEYESKYGKNSIVLMQVGHFYECYAVDNSQEAINADNLYKLSDILNIQLTRKNKSIVENSRKNPLMIGVNLFSIDKYIQLLLNNSYTCVIIDQVTEPPEPERAVTNIFSPGTNITYNSKGETNNLMTIYIDTYKDITKQSNNISIGISIIDLSTGKNSVAEIYCKSDDSKKSLDETFRFIQTHDPKEIVIIQSSTDNETLFSEDYLCNYLELGSRVVHYKTKIDKEYLNISYQKQFLGKIFKETGLLSVIEYLDLETKTIGTISYVYLLDFAYSHNESIISKIEKPNIYDESSNLILTNNSIHQLNVVNHHSHNINLKYNSLFSVINNCSNALGRRSLRDYILNPIIDTKHLNERYNMIQCLTERDPLTEKPYFIYIEECLSKIVDIERLFRRMGLGLLQPADFSGLDFSCVFVTKLYDYIDSKSVLKTTLKTPTKKTIEKFREFIKIYKELFDLNEISKYHVDKITNSFFNKGKFESIDNIQKTIDISKETFKKIAEKLSSFIDDNSNMIKVESNERDGYYLSLTNKRYSVLKQKFIYMNYNPVIIHLSDGTNFKLDIKEINTKTTTKTSVRLVSDYLKKLSSDLCVAKYKIGNICKKHYLESLAEFHTNYKNTFREICNFVAVTDVVKCGAKTATLFGYKRPEIDNKYEGRSYLNIEKIRHPIIERIQTNTEYVTNDIKIDPEQNGTLLYGTNAAGKSSLMKAIGLNVILAQAGFFVAAETFKFYPYKYIFTRINNNDNIFKGESSFAVEMSELRSILKRSTPNSLILGDELCSGTESISAQSIFAASVVKLMEKHSSFIFATHLHELCKMQIIKDLETLKIYHLKVEYDVETQKLRYDRKLEPGSGPAIYGLEVCKAMDMSPDFLELAQIIRKDIMNIDKSLFSKKKSNYNAKVFVDKCMMCKANAEDVHHIKFQSCADRNNIIDGYIQKDSESNLVCLCKVCHDKVHNKDIEIFGYVQTSSGVELDFKFLKEKEIAEKKQKRKKYNDKQVDIIKNMSRSVSKKIICHQLLENHNIKISSATLTKIWNDNY